MKREKLFEIMGETDDDLVESAAHTNAIHQKMTWRQWILTAACVALIVGAVIPFAKAASEGRSWISVLLPWQEKAADDPVEPGTDALPSFTWKENGKGRLSPDSLEVIQFNGTYYEGLNMSDTALLDRFNLPHEIKENDIVNTVGKAKTDGGKELTLYEYQPDQQAVYIAECEGRYTYAVFCNRIREDVSQYDTAQELFSIYGIHQPEDIVQVEIGGKRITKPEKIKEFYNALCTAQAMGNAEWNHFVFNGMTEKESSNLYNPCGYHAGNHRDFLPRNHHKRRSVLSDNPICGMGNQLLQARQRIGVNHPTETVDKELKHENNCLSKTSNEIVTVNVLQQLSRNATEGVSAETPFLIKKIFM